MSCKVPKAKKKFIDRKKAVTFNLVHRSQRDPLIADETAPQRVLVPVNASIPVKKEKEPHLSVEQRKEEQKKYGIYFDDDYNYLQHLKDTREVTMVLQPKVSHKGKKVNDGAISEQFDDGVEEKIQLPSSVFASEVEEDVGLLNKAASQGLCLQLDPDVVAALDEDFDFDDPDNELEDNFIEMAMGEGRPNMPSWDKEDTKSRFSQYSMSSSVIRRNEGLSLLDNRFEKLYAEYDDTELGALDMDEITGFMPESHRMLLQAAEEFEESQRRKELSRENDTRMRYLQQIAEESDEDLVSVDVDPQEKWDCETILSTYSNLYNHPKVIEEPKKPTKIKINAKTGIPESTLGKDNTLTMKSLAKFNAMNKNEDVSDDERTNAESVLSTLSVLSIR
ncbi:LTV1 protein [Danaus plexippus plexippus]|uniref:Protein LTV1 homolog n=1 Tax=Danaus plexippus plexippus TaxID=278856 RepID=A0A212ESW0_DANPL|nr:LTV1 protein [Danaus plexippus plexippus]